MTRFVLGLGGTVDYEIVWDAAVVEHLVAEYGIGPGEADPHITVDSPANLIRSLLGFLADGAGGERFVASSAIIEQVAARFAKKVTLGGTCVRAAIAMSTLKVASTVHLVSIDDTVRAALPAAVRYVCSAQRDTLDPHLIVQYPANARIAVGHQELLTTHPDRVIYANDPPHRELRIADGLDAELATADVFLVSSFNVIQDPAVLEDRLARVGRAARSLPPGALVMFEDAGYHVPALSHRVRDAMAELADVYSLNEHEAQAYLGRPVDLLDAHDVADAVDELHAAIPGPTLVVHTKHWALASGTRAPALGAALAGGITMAATRYRLGDGFGAPDYARTTALAPGAAGARLAAHVARLRPDLVAVPAYDLSDVAHPTTIGLGDTFVGGFLAALADPGTAPLDLGK